MLDSPYNIPEHVPDHLVFDFDYFLEPKFLFWPQVQVAQHLHTHAPDIFYTPRNGGHWVVARSELGGEVFRRNDLFSSDPKHNRWKQLQTRHIPLQYDPPDHEALRKLFTSFFTPNAVRKMEPEIRALMVSLIDEVYAQGTCDFVKAIGERFPVTVFLKMANAPLSQREDLVSMSNRYMHSANRAESDAGFRDLTEYVERLIAERRANLGDDLISHTIKAKFVGRSFTEDEVLGAVNFFFLAGLDTVSSMLSGIALYLARHPQQYQLLASNPEILPNALEELMRLHGPTISDRGASKDFEFSGINFKEGDRVLLLPQIYGLDDREVEDPTRVDFNRTVSRHLAFGAGPHRCLGSHLARMEIKIFLEEWLKRVPEFSLASGTDPLFCGGIVWVPTEARLQWQVTN